MTTVVVLGANCFSGQDLIDLLLDNKNYRVIGVGRAPERSVLFLRYKMRTDLSRWSYHQLNLNGDMGSLLELLDAETPEFIVNFAAQGQVAPSWEHPEHWFETNTMALARLVNHLRRQKYLRRYLHISTPEVYGCCVGTVREDAALNPSTPYAASKAGADMIAKVYHRQYGFPLLLVRATNVYGARQQLFRIIPRSIIYMKMGRMIQLHGGGAAVKSFIHIRDVSRGEMAILERGRIGEVYHLSTEQGVAVRDLVRLIAQRLGKSLEDVTEMVAERPGQDAAYVIDSTKARTELGWQPQITLDAGITEVAAWVQEYWDEIQQLPLEYVHQR